MFLIIYGCGTCKSYSKDCFNKELNLGKETLVLTFGINAFHKRALILL